MTSRVLRTEPFAERSLPAVQANTRSNLTQHLLGGGEIFCCAAAHQQRRGEHRRSAVALGAVNVNGIRGGRESVEDNGTKRLIAAGAIEHRQAEVGSPGDHAARRHEFGGQIHHQRSARRKIPRQRPPPQPYPRQNFMTGRAITEQAARMPDATREKEERQQKCDSIRFDPSRRALAQNPRSAADITDRHKEEAERRPKQQPRRPSRLHRDRYTSGRQKQEAERVFHKGFSRPETSTSSPTRKPRSAAAEPSRMAISSRSLLPTRAIASPGFTSA